MTREFFAEPMREIGEDYDQSLADIHVMLDAVAHSLADWHEIDVEDTRVRSCDNGGVVYSMTLTGYDSTWRANVPLDDPSTLDAINGEPVGFCRHVEARIAQRVCLFVLSVKPEKFSPPVAWRFSRG